MMEASALSQAGRRGLLPRKSKLLRLQGDEKLIAMVRDGNPSAFETIVDRYQGRLLGFCRQMLRSNEDAEDVLQEVFVNAYKAMVADSREINLRPWLYRIARNRCLNHLRRPTADARESMDMVPEVEAASTAETVHNREEFRQLLTDVSKLPETQRSALLLREMDALSYEEIAETMDTTVPSVKSLLVRARMSLSEASEARMLTCGEVRLSLAEAAEGITKVSGPVRRHVRECEECAGFRKQLRTDSKAFSTIFPAGPLLALKAYLLAKLGGFGGGATAGGGACAGGGGTAAAGACAGGSAVAGGTAVGGSAAAGGATIAGGAAAAGGAAGLTGAAIAAGGGGAMGSALGAKAVAGVVTAAVVTAGAFEVNKSQPEPEPVTPVGAKVQQVVVPPTAGLAAVGAIRNRRPEAAVGAAVPAPTAASLLAEQEPKETVAAATEDEETEEEASSSSTESEAANAEDTDEAVSDPTRVDDSADSSSGEAGIGLGSDGSPVVPTDPDSIVIGAPAPTGPTGPDGESGTPPSSGPPPVGKPPPGEEPPATEPPPVDEPPAEPEPPIEEPPPVEDPPAQEQPPPAEEPPPGGEQPPAEDQPAEEPPTEETPAAEEPPAEGSPTDEPSPTP